MDKSAGRLLISGVKVLNLLLLGTFLWSLGAVDWSSEFLHSGNIDSFLKILDGFVSPDISLEVLGMALEAAVRTLAYAVSGLTIGLVLAFFAGVMASGVISRSRLEHRFSKVVWRGWLGVVRGVHELVWAWLFVAYIGLSPFAGILALAIPYGAALGRVFADILNDVSKEPLAALASAGAGKWQLLLYGYLPAARTDMISYIMYRLECAIRSSAIMSFVGLGGLGYSIQLALNDLNYSRASTFVYFLIVLIMLVDVWSNQLRKELA